VERGWRITRFDHARARFALRGAHAAVACTSCHKTPRFKDAPSACADCHLKDDRHKASLGDRCDSCHNQRDWRLWVFDHQKQTSFALEGSHAQVRCESCHGKPAPAGRPIAAVDTTCVACHRHDDIHDAAFGTRCEQCHTVTKWRQVSNRARVTGAVAGQRGSAS
jgi:hypothetical protein